MFKGNLEDRIKHATDVATRAYIQFKKLDVDNSITNPLDYTERPFSVAYTNSLLGYLTNDGSVSRLKLTAVDLETNMRMLAEVYSDATIKLGGVLQDSPDVLDKTARIIYNNIKKSNKLLEIVKDVNDLSIKDNKVKEVFRVIFGGFFDIRTVEDVIYEHVNLETSNGKYELSYNNFDTSIFGTKDGERLIEDVMHNEFGEVSTSSLLHLHNKQTLTIEDIESDYDLAIKLMMAYDVMFRTKDMTSGDKSVLSVRLALLSKKLDVFVRRCKLRRNKYLILHKESGIVYIDSNTLTGEEGRVGSDIYGVIKLVSRDSSYLWKDIKVGIELNRVKELSTLYNIQLEDDIKNNLVELSKIKVKELVKNINKEFNTKLTLGDVDYKKILKSNGDIPKDVISSIGYLVSQPLGLLVETIVEVKSTFFLDNKTTMLLAISRLLAKVTSRELVILD